MLREGNSEYDRICPFSHPRRNERMYFWPEKRNFQDIFT
jgi:hypothetical protein